MHRRSLTIQRAQCMLFMVELRGTPARGGVVMAQLAELVDLLQSPHLRIHPRLRRTECADSHDIRPLFTNAGNY